MTEADDRTTAVSRSLSDLHQPMWLVMIASSAGIRTLLQHPLNIAIARKRVLVEPTSIQHILSKLMFADNSAGVTRCIRNVYRGCGITVLGNVVGEVSYLWTLERTRYELREHHSLQADATAGLVGDAASILLVTPLAIVANRQMTAGVGMSSSNEYTTAAGTLKKMWGDPASTSVYQRVRGMYVGFSASCAMIPASAVWWSSYGQLKRTYYSMFSHLFQQREEHLVMVDTPAAGGGSGVFLVNPVGVLLRENWLSSATDNPLLNGMAGVSASMLTAVVYNPVNVVRTRLQVSSSGQRSITRICKALWRNEGLLGFFKGTGATVATSVVDGLLFSTMYEFTKLSTDLSIQ